MKAILGLIMAGTLVSLAQAAPTVGLNQSSVGSIILVEGGCGRDYHRGPNGGCLPNWRVLDGHICPPGWHLGVYGRRCWPN